MGGDVPGYECGLRGMVSWVEGIDGGHTASLSLRTGSIGKISRNGDVVG